ncbi:MAG: hypothetical protein KDI71_21825 [Xanthomonadales bacterium]|nr:hypothetical protein [Xanthomonadales bacterium]
MDETLHSVDELIAALYPVARQMAARQLSGSSAQLQRTELVANAYIRIKQANQDAALSRNHFLSLLARVLRQAAVDQWRQDGRRAAAGSPVEQTLSALATGGASMTSVLRFDQLIGQLEQFDRTGAEVVSLRVFGGLTGEEIAAELGVGSATVARKWRMASAWLREELNR